MATPNKPLQSGACDGTQAIEESAGSELLVRLQRSGAASRSAPWGRLEPHEWLALAGCVLGSQALLPDTAQLEGRTLHLKSLWAQSAGADSLDLSSPRGAAHGTP